MTLNVHRVLVTGSRDWANPAVIHQALDAELGIARSQGLRMLVVHGGAPGADRYADAWARRNFVEVIRYPARWRENGVYNPQAGLSRNRKMVQAGAEVCLAFIREGSRGASHCSRLAESAGIPVNRYT